MNVNKKKFLEKLAEVAERELELAESGIFRVPEDRDIRIPEEHKIIENLLQLLGYGGKRVYVPSLQSEKGTVEQIIVSDYKKGINVFARNYKVVLQSRLKGLGIFIEKGKLSRIVSKTKKELSH